MAMHESIRHRLQAIAREEQVLIFYACESGSRAWGFPSADSDYDVRFLYLRPPDWYLSIDLEQRSDVIERPIDHPFDLSGWDLRKALQLYARSNAVLFEWLQSPIVYAERTDLPDRLRALMRACYSPKACFYHYLHVARAIAERHMRGNTIRPKRYFYMLRPLLACRWVEEGRGVVPMAFQTLVEQLVKDQTLRQTIHQLLADKRQGAEQDEGPRIPVLDAYITGAIERFEDVAPTLEAVRPDLERLNRLFRQAVETTWPTYEQA